MPMLSLFIAIAFTLGGAWGIYVGISGWQAEDAASTTLLSGLLFAAGVIYLLKISGTIKWPAPQDQPAAPAEDPPKPARDWGRSPDPDEKVAFSVIGGEDDDSAIDRVEAFLEKDPRVETTVSETGRWYSVPDGDDLPEWTALRVYCRRRDRDALMDETRTYLSDQLGKHLTVNYF